MQASGITTAYQEGSLIGCNCGGNKRRPGVGDKIPPKAPPASQPPPSVVDRKAADRKPDGRRRYAVVGGRERKVFRSLGDARAFQRERGGRVR